MRYRLVHGTEAVILRFGHALAGLTIWSSAASEASPLQRRVRRRRADAPTSSAMDAPKVLGVDERATPQRRCWRGRLNRHAIGCYWPDSSTTRKTVSGSA